MSVDIQSVTTSIKKKLYLGVSLTALSLAVSPTAQAYDECGSAAGPIHICADTSLNPYPRIFYDTPTGLTLNIANGVAVESTMIDGIRLRGTGSDLLRIEFGAGASVETSGDDSQGLYIVTLGGSSSATETDISGNVDLISTKTAWDGLLIAGWPFDRRQPHLAYGFKQSVRRLHDPTPGK